MSTPPSHRALYGVIVIATAAACCAAHFGLGRGAERFDASDSPATAATPVEPGASFPVAMDEPMATAEHDVDAGRLEDAARPEVPSPPPRTVHGADAAGAGQSRAIGETLVTVLPRPILELARTTVWDEPASAELERFMTAAFDADGDGTLDDRERILAVRSLRDAMWPAAPGGTAAALSDAGDEAPDRPASAALSARDRRLHHDVDESRRRDRDEDDETDGIGEDVRTTIVRRFRLDDDGRLTATEFARYMRHRNAASAVADLNGDGMTDDADLRMFLDVASPIGGP